MKYIIDWICVVFKWIVCSHAECTCKFGLCNPLYKQCKPDVGCFLRFLRVAEALSLSIYNFFFRCNTGLCSSLTQWRHHDGVYLPLIYLRIFTSSPKTCSASETSSLDFTINQLFDPLTRYSHTFPLQFFAEMFVPIIERFISCSSSGVICEPNLIHSW